MNLQHSAPITTPPSPPEGYNLRPIEARDEAYLLALYTSTREEELRPVPWSIEEKSAFLMMQFKEQQRQYQTTYPDAGYYVIERDGNAVGRIYIHWRRGNSLHLMEITVETGQRRKGIGGTLIHWLMNEAVKSAERMTLYVEEFNPAYAWYRRFGFQPLSTHGIYTLMEWKPL